MGPGTAHLGVGVVIASVSQAAARIVRGLAWKVLEAGPDTQEGPGRWKLLP